MLWLIEDTTLDAMTLDVQPTAAQLDQFAARSGAASTVRGKTAVIPIEGVLTPKPDVMAYLFGGGNTTYGEVQQALAEANADAAVSTIELHVDSPGGNVVGLFETMDAIAASAKPVRAVATRAASAAYGIAASASEIVATSRGADFGSIGTKTARRIDSRVVTITSTNAPDKAPDASTEEGVAAIRAELDEVEALFIDGIAAGRGVSSEKVVADFGKGRMFLAEAALERGLIDSIATATPQPTPATSGNKQEAILMDLETLRAQHSETFAAAVQLGVDKERDRVSAFAVYGKQSGETELALDSIRSGAALTAELTAQFTMAAASRSHAAAQLDDDAAAGAALGGAADSTQTAEELDAAKSGELTNAWLTQLGVEV